MDLVKNKMKHVFKHNLVIYINQRDLLNKLVLFCGKRNIKT